MKQMNPVGTKIKEIRLKKGMSQEELATESQVSLRTIQRIENNENEPRGKTLQLICETLDINIEELLDYGKHEDHQFLGLFHLSIILGTLFGVGSILIPLILWMTKKDKINGLQRIGARTLNFQIWWLIFMIIIPAIGFVLIFNQGVHGIKVMTSIMLIPIVMMIINAILAIAFAILNFRGKQITYPSIIPMIK
ncbi:MAG: helix-turn-helix domain-containing protein [Nonlabens ulvanivorans]|uniref:helix-turn-helix domain-containing protein n=1 Tax=Nonlabens ulvanivorans TaxID=906888 RepID=UPI003298A035